MKSFTSKNRGIAHLLLVLMVAVAGVIAVSVFLIVKNKPQPVTSYEECVATGHPVQESHPSVCSANGMSFTEPGVPAHGLCIRGVKGACNPGLGDEATKSVLKINELGIQFELPKTLASAYYVIKTIDGAETANLSTRSLKETDCSAEKSGLGLLIQHHTGDNHLGTPIEDYPGVKKIDGHYYVLISPQASCGAKAIAAAKAFQKAFKSLKAIPAL